MKLLYSIPILMASIAKLTYAQDFVVTFTSVDAVFDDTTTADQITLVYAANTEPTGQIAGSDKYYELVVLRSDCATVDEVTIQHTNAIELTANWATGVLTTTLDVDTSALEADANIWTRAPDSKSGSIDFCVKMSLMNKDGHAMASETTDISITVDITKDFEVLGTTYANEIHGVETDTGAIIDYTLDVYLCDNTNTLVTHAAAFVPGELFTFCVKATNADADVTGLHSVQWENSGSGINIVIVDAAEAVTYGAENSITCAGGICRINTLVYEALFEQVVTGTLTEDLASIKMVGTAMITFTRRGLAGTRGAAVQVERRVEAGGASQDFELEVELAESGACGLPSFAMSVMMAAGMVAGFFV